MVPKLEDMSFQIHQEDENGDCTRIQCNRCTFHISFGRGYLKAAKVHEKRLRKSLESHFGEHKRADRLWLFSSAVVVTSAVVLYFKMAQAYPARSFWSRALLEDVMKPFWLAGCSLVGGDAGATFY